MNGPRSVSERLARRTARRPRPRDRLKAGYAFWASISHFIHSPFYVYAYAFGDCLVNSLYAVYERAAAGFGEQYLAMLSAGGSKRYKSSSRPSGSGPATRLLAGRALGIAAMIDELGDDRSGIS